MVLNFGAKIFGMTNSTITIKLNSYLIIKINKFHRFKHRKLEYTKVLKKMYTLMKINNRSNKFNRGT